MVQITQKLEMFYCLGKRMKNIVFILIFLLTGSLLLQAQDIQFTQYYSAPSYLAPSFAGGTNGSRVVTNYRSQWPKISKGYRTFALSFDHYFPAHKSGIGIFFIKDVAGTSRLSYTNISVQYSYLMRVSRDWYVRPGVQFTQNQRSLDYSRLIFGDQITLTGIIPTSVELNNQNLLEKVSYIDFAASLLVYNKKYWGGFTFDHLNKPNQSLMQVLSPVPIEFSLWGGSKFVTNDRKDMYDEQSVTASFFYKAQGKYDQLDIGAYFRKLPLTFGLWYRGLPLLKRYAPGYGNSDAFCFIVGYTLKDIKTAYSYDFTISRLASNTGGSHEISIIYEFNQDQKPRRKKAVIIPCPKF